jgi:hypothetical protein
MAAENLQRVRGKRRIEMKKRIRLLIAIFALPALLSACIIAPWDGYYGGGHHHGGYGGRGGWYDGRR